MLSPVNRAGEDRHSRIVRSIRGAAHIVAARTINANARTKLRRLVVPGAAPLLGRGRGRRRSPPPLGRAIPLCCLFICRISMPAMSRRLSGDLGRIAGGVAKSLEGSLARLRLDRVDIFHLHNAITETGGGEALSVRQVLGDVVPAFERLRQQGKTRFL